MANSRLQVDLDQDTLAVLDSIMVTVRRAEANRKIGAGTIAARILQRVAKREDLIRVWFYDEGATPAKPLDVKKTRIIGNKE